MAEEADEVSTGPGPEGGNVGKLPTVSVQRAVSENAGGTSTGKPVPVGLGIGMLPVPLARGIVE